MTASPGYEYLEEEIDLRSVVLFIWRARWWMLGGAALFLLFAGIYLYRQPPKYTTESWIRWRTTVKVGSVQLVQPPVKDLDRIVTSGAWWAVNIEGGERVDNITIKAETPKKQSRIHLTVIANTPEEAYEWAQRWTNAVLAWLQKSDERYLTTLQQAVEEARVMYQLAQQSYMTYLTRDPRPSLQTQIEEVRQLRKCALERKRYFAFVLADVREVQKRWTPQETLSPQDVLLFLTLQQRTFSGAPCGGRGEFVMQISDASFPNLDSEIAKDRLEGLETYLQVRLQEETQRLLELEQKLISLQEQLEEAERQVMELQVEQEQAWEHWQQLKQKYELTKMYMDLYPVAEIEVPPVRPKQPQTERPVFHLTVASIIGAFLGLIGFGIYQSMTAPASSDKATPEM